MVSTLSRNAFSPGVRSWIFADALRAAGTLRWVIGRVFVVGLVLRDFTVALRVVGALRFVVRWGFFVGLGLRGFVERAIAWSLSAGGLSHRLMRLV